MSFAKITIEEFDRRVQVFTKTLPNNPDGKPWLHDDICRVMLKAQASRQRSFNPAVYYDKIDIHHDLRTQYYADIKRAAIAKTLTLRRGTAMLQLRTQ